jgi:hypothetical protein
LAWPEKKILVNHISRIGTKKRFSNFYVTYKKNSKDNFSCLGTLILKQLVIPVSPSENLYFVTNRFFLSYFNLSFTLATVISSALITSLCRQVGEQRKMLLLPGIDNNLTVSRRIYKYPQTISIFTVCVSAERKAVLGGEVRSQGADSHPPSSTLGKAGRNHLNKEITPLHPTGIGERFSQTISNLGLAALLGRCELPPINESAELTQGSL